MTLRTRLLLAFGAVVLIPIALLAFGLRHEMTIRLSEEYQVRVDSVKDVIREDLQRESAEIGIQLDALAKSFQDDNRFRLALAAEVAAVDSERTYLIDYAEASMRLAGLSMLQIQDADGRIISSGHFKHEHGRVEGELKRAIADSHGGVAFLTARTAEGEFLALVRAAPVAIRTRGEFTLVGGVAVDDAFLARLARDPTIVVTLRYTGGGISSSPIKPADDAAVSALQVPLIRTGPETPLEVEQARLEVSQPLTPLRMLQSSVDTWFLMTAIGAGLTALLLAVWVSTRISRPLATLAAKTAVLDLDRLDVTFEGGTDEVGSLSRLLGDLVTRLRTSTVRVRDAERRATVGDLARQINHDIKNGLIPLRNVMRHLEQVERSEPTSLPSVFAERRQTVDSSIAYLETLATSYQRLSPHTEQRDCDLNALITDLVRAAQGHEHVEFGMQLTPNLPTVIGDPISFRRILENLTTNAVESLQSKPGRVIVSTELVQQNAEPPSIRVTVADTGRGIAKDETSRIFNDFYTTKEGGTGLGLSIVRRLVMDLSGSLAVESESGKGTRIMIDFPAGNPKRT